MKKHLSLFLIALSASLWGISGLFVRKLNELGFSTYEIVCLRLFFTALIFTAFYLIVDKSAFKIKLKDLWCFLGTGVLGILGTSLCYFETISRASLSTACILMYTAPIFVIFLSAILFKEKITLVKITGLVLTIIGCVFCCYEKGAFNLSLPAFLIGIGSGVAYGLYSIFSRCALNKGYESKTILLYTFIFGFLGSLIFVPYKNLAINVQSANFLLPSILLAVLATLLPYLLYTLGLKNMENGKASIIASLEIVVSILAGIIAYGEIPTAVKIVGILLIFIAIILLNANLKIFNKKSK